MKVLDEQTGKEEMVIDRTSNSFLVTQGKIKVGGINCDNWFTERDFHQRFKIIVDIKSELK